MIENILYYFVLGYSLSVGVLCGIATMGIIYYIIDSIRINSRGKKQ